MSEYINADEIRKAINILIAPGAVFEIRALGTAKKDVLSGYFRDADTLFSAIKTINLRNRNVYITLGKVKEECFSRTQSEHFVQSPTTTGDNEITAYRWLFVDLDPVRMSGVSSTDAELKAARILSRQVREYLQGIGFSSPVVALSGNGYHLLYRIDIRNSKKAEALVEKCLKVLASIFNTDAVKIDTTNYNPSRICKLHGTLAQKGRSTKERPHRMSKILEVPDPIEITPRGVLQALADELPDDTPPTRKQKTNQTQNEFDVVEFMHKYGMTYTEDSNDRAKIFKLDACPFDHSHRDGDAKIFLYTNGAVAFKCHHNSCRDYKWQDVRLKFEPDAYDHDTSDDERIEAGWRQHKKALEAELTEPINKSKKKPPKIRKLKKSTALMEKVLPDPRVYIGVGDELPLLVEGTCILSAKPKLGKSWLALGMCLAVANGEDFLGYHTYKCSTLYLDLETSEVLQQRRIRKALNGKPCPENFYLDTETNRLEGGLIEQLEAYLKEDPDIGLIVIDVFQIVRSDSKNFKESEYDHAYRDITPLNDFAQSHHIAIVLVCHDRKNVEPDDPFANILGSTGLQGAATQMIVMYRKRPKNLKSPIHISVKGKTIDGLPNLDVKLEDAQWFVVEDDNSEETELEEMQKAYEDSEIRTAVLAIANHYDSWRGRCGELINRAIFCDVPIKSSAKAVGRFLGVHQGRFLEDGVKISIEPNGTGGKTYMISKQTLISQKNVDIKENQHHANVDRDITNVDSNVDEDEYDFLMPADWDEIPFV